MNNYKGISADDKHRIVAALKARGAGIWPHTEADLIHPTSARAKAATA